MPEIHGKPHPQMKQIQELLQSADLRQRVQAATNEGEAAKLVSDAGVSKGYPLNEAWVRQAFDDVKLARKPASLTDGELQELASTHLMSDTPPKLCHTDSCGGNHPGCC